MVRVELLGYIVGVDIQTDKKTGGSRLLFQGRSLSVLKCAFLDLCMGMRRKTD